MSRLLKTLRLDNGILLRHQSCRLCWMGSFVASAHFTIGRVHLHRVVTGTVCADVVVDLVIAAAVTVAFAFAADCAGACARSCALIDRAASSAVLGVIPTTATIPTHTPVLAALNYVLMFLSAASVLADFFLELFHPLLYPIPWSFRVSRQP